MVHCPIQIMSTIQQTCKLTNSNDFGLYPHQYYNSHAHHHHHHHHNLNNSDNSNSPKIGNNILSIATNSLIEGNLFSGTNKDNLNNNTLTTLDSSSIGEKILPNYSPTGNDFLSQNYPATHQTSSPSSWYQTANSSRNNHFHSQMNSVNNGNGPFTEPWAAAAAAAAAATSMVNVIPHCNYSIPTSPVYGHSLNPHRHQSPTLQYNDRSTYQYPYNISSATYIPNSMDNINSTLLQSPTIITSDLQLERNTALDVEINGGDNSLCHDEKPQIGTGEELDKSDDEGLQCNLNGTYGNRPQPARSPYEWIKKPSYQNQTTTNGFLNRKKGKTRTKDKYRVVYSDHQRLELEKEFHYSRYITIRRKSELASMLSLSERQVKIWFQNRRAKERKQQKKREEIMIKNKDQSTHILTHHTLLNNYNSANDGQMSLPQATGQF